MNKYRIKIKVLSSLGTPLMGDTIFGHLCWGLKLREGEGALTSFLEKYDSTPPLIISDGFPEGHLPVPLLEPAMPEKGTTLENINKIKKFKKIKYLDAGLFFNEEFSFSEKRLLSTQEKSGEETTFKKTAKMHNTINRITGTTSNGEGGLYASEEIWLSPDNNVFDIYVVSEFEKEKIRQLFLWTFENGYGADKSTGKGNITVESVEQVHFTESGNRAMALGSFVPEKDENLINLRADVFTKFGKLGGNYVLSQNPFKKPLVMYRQGSTFSSEDKKEYTGS
ncbi:MAG: CRISPR-associated protein Csm4, partial [bacterium]